MPVQTKSKINNRRVVKPESSSSSGSSSSDSEEDSDYTEEDAKNEVVDPKSKLNYAKFL